MAVKDAKQVGASRQLECPTTVVLLPVENVRSFHRFAIGVGAFERLGQHLAVFGNNVLTRLMIFPASLFHFPIRRTRIFSFDRNLVEW